MDRYGPCVFLILYVNLQVNGKTDLNKQDI